jgi:hypothetical protein
MYNRKEGNRIIYPILVSIYYNITVLLLLDIPCESLNPRTYPLGRLKFGETKLQVITLFIHAVVFFPTLQEDLL